MEATFGEQRNHTTINPFRNHYTILQNTLNLLSLTTDFLKFYSSLFYFGKNYTIVIEIILFTMSV